MKYIIFGFAFLFVIQAIAIWLNRAPRGYQDETGFHLLQATVRGTARAHNPEERGATPRPATNSRKGVPDAEVGSQLGNPQAASPANPEGQRSVRRKLFLVHREAVTLARGPIPAGLHCCHKCDTPSCVNPDHIFLGTAKQNAQDCFSKGRKSGAVKPKLNWEKVKEIRQLHSSGESQSSIGRKFGVNQTTIRDIAIGDSWANQEVSSV